MDLLGKLLALLAALSWAFAVILYKRAGDSIKPLALNWYKTLLTSLLLLPVLFFSKWNGFSRPDYVKVILSGLLGIAASDTLFFIALDKLGASRAAIVDCFYVPFVMLASWGLLSQTPRMAQIGGMLAIMAAIAVVAMEHRGEGKKVEHKNLILGFSAGAFAMALMGLAITLMQPLLKQQSVWVVTELRMLPALAALSVMMFFRKDRRALFRSLTSHGAWRHALPASLLGNLLAQAAWVAAFKFTAVNTAAILNQTSTFFTLALAAWFLKEPLTRPRLIGTVLAFAGAAVVSLN